MTDGPSYVCSDMPARLHQPHSFSAAQLVSFPLLANETSNNARRPYCTDRSCSARCSDPSSHVSRRTYLGHPVVCTPALFWWGKG